MGSMVSRWWWGGDPDEKNKISGMSLRDIYNVQSSWKPVYTNPSGNGFLIFSRLFDEEPETKLFFKDIAHATEEEMAVSVVFKAHLINLMASLNIAIQNLRDPEVVIAGMHKLGNSHRKLHVERRHFWVLKQVLVIILRNDLKLSDDVVESWGRFVDFIYAHLLPKLHQ